MPGIHSKLAVVKLGTAAAPLTVTDISTFCDSVEFSRELDEVECTTFGAGAFRDYISGFAEGTVSLSGPWRRAVETHFAALFTAFQNGTIDEVSFEYGPEGTDAGDIKKTCTLSMTSYEGPGADIGDAQQWSAEFRIKAPGVTDGTY